MLADQVDAVIGVDTHRDRHALALVAAPTGALIDHCALDADAAGYAAAVAWARRRAPGRRAWAVEGTGAYGAGLASHLAQAGERVLEIDRPERRGERSRAKDDLLDAVRAARTALSRPRQAIPRAGGRRAALRVLLVARSGAVDGRVQALCQMRALVVSAPEPLRARCRGLGREELVRRCAALRVRPGDEPELAATATALRILARRARTLGAEADELRERIRAGVDELAPGLLDEPGVGPIAAASLLVSWSHRGRLRGEGAFARLGGLAPIPASSGQVVRRRLDRGGDRQLNRALHTIVLTRRRIDPRTRAYIARRVSEGKSSREAVRSLTRYVARHLYRRLEAIATEA